ncbi:MAG: hypothetical protein ABSD42_04110 [Candidatus Bathyarchaeia archaeon]|jgi:hypothetical protein
MELNENVPVETDSNQAFPKTRSFNIRIPTRLYDKLEKDAKENYYGHKVRIIIELLKGKYDGTVSQTFPISQSTELPTTQQTANAQPQPSVTSTPQQVTAISQLKTGMTDQTVRGYIARKEKPQTVSGGYTKCEFLLVEAREVTHTNYITLILWGFDIGKVDIGDSVEIKKGRVTEFRGRKELSPWKGSIQKIEGVT